ncbi:hypothetical protein [Piscirickettsia salmonis]|nr:hypothetical protein [Piscirickettsia salmonis]
MTESICSHCHERKRRYLGRYFASLDVQNTYRGSDAYVLMML